MKKIKNRQILLLTLILGMLCVIFSGPVDAATIHINDSSAYSNTIPLNQQIQDIINSAAKGDTVEFLGKFYENLSLVINKPLNIITLVQTTISSSLGSPIFLITGTGSSGTNVTGFNLQGDGDGIVVQNTGNVTISKNKLNHFNGTGIKITGSSNINVKDNLVNNSKTGSSVTNSKNVAFTGNTIKNSKSKGIDVQKGKNVTINKNQIQENGNDGVSAEDSDTVNVDENSISNNGNNGVTLKNTSKTQINNNTIDGNQGHGIYFDEKVNDTKITGNNITNNKGAGFELDKSGANTLIHMNYITGNRIGININDASDNLVITQNFINGNVLNHDDDDDGTSGIGINFGSNYRSSSTFNVNNNAIFGNQRREVEIRDTEEPVIFGANWYGSSIPSGCNLCPKLRTQYMWADVTVSNTGTGQATIYIDPSMKNIASLLPSTDAYFLMSDGSIITVNLVNGTGTIKFDPSLSVVSVRVTNQRFDQNNIRLIVEQNPPVAPGGGSGSGKGGSGSNSGAGGSGAGSGASSGAGSGGSSGGNSGGSSDAGSGSSSGGTTSGSTPSSVGAMAAAATQGSTDPSSGKSGSSSSAGGSQGGAQELFIDNPVKNPQLWSVVGVVVLILLVIIAYYRKDIMNMLRNSK